MSQESMKDQASSMNKDSKTGADENKNPARGLWMGGTGRVVGKKVGNMIDDRRPCNYCSKAMVHRHQHYCVRCIRSYNLDPRPICKRCGIHKKHPRDRCCLSCSRFQSGE